MRTRQRFRLISIFLALAALSACSKSNTANPTNSLANVTNDDLVKSQLGAQVNASAAIVLRSFRTRVLLQQNSPQAPISLQQIREAGGEILDEQIICANDNERKENSTFLSLLNPNSQAIEKFQMNYSLATGPSYIDTSKRLLAGNAQFSIHFNAYNMLPNIDRNGGSSINNYYIDQQGIAYYITSEEKTALVVGGIAYETLPECARSIERRPYAERSKDGNNRR